MIKRTWAMTGVWLALGCSAGGASDDPATVTPAATPGTLLPGNTSPTVTGVTPGTGAGTGELFDPEQVEPTEECDGIIPVVFRDFNQTHPDFEREFAGDGVRLNLIEPELGTDGKPVFASSLGCPAQQGTQTCRTDYNADKEVITSAATFDQWYRDVPNVNQTFERELELRQNPNTGLYE